MANVGPKGVIRYEETFATDNIAGGTPGSSDGAAADGIAWVCSGDSGNTAFARAVNAARGLHIAGATDATGASDMIEICSDQIFMYGQTGHSSVEIIVQFDDVTNMAFNFGFNDDSLDDSNTLPIEIGTAAWTLNATDGFCGLVYDTGATNNELHCFWANGAVVGMTDADSSVNGKAVRMTGMAPTNNKWLYMKVEIQDRGSGNGNRATFLAVDHNGRSVEKVFNTSVDRDLALCYYFGMENRTASAHNCRIRYMAWEQSIETD